MSIYSLQYRIKNILIILFILGFVSFLYAQQPNLDSTHNRGYLEFQNIPEQKKDTVISKESLAPSPALTWQEEKNLSVLQKEARMYRAQGLELQRIGNADAAMSLYQKALELDPAYAVAYNDLGIIYEAKGFIDRAEECYLKAIKIDSGYLSAYTNLALLYENKRQLNKAAFYWKKRAESGLPDDPWTEKARERLEDISLVLSNRPIAEDAREQTVVEFLKDVAKQKSLLKKDDKALARHYFERAKQKFKKGDEVTALKLAIDAAQLDSSNAEIEEFIKKTQTRLLSK